MLDLHDLSVKHAEHVGIQSSIDLHEKRAYDKVQYRGANADGEEGGCAGGNCNERGGRHTKDVYDPTTELVAEDAPLRYDVDIVTKLIVYAGTTTIIVCRITKMHDMTDVYPLRHRMSCCIWCTFDVPILWSQQLSNLHFISLHVL